MFESNLPCNIKRINERLEIFISSAQSDEGDLSWKELRLKIKKRLQSCPFLNPFIFEDSSSSISSNQRYEYQVIRSDIVVLLLKDEIRPGTNNEYQIVKKNKKPLLLYFIGNSKNSQIQAIKKEIQESDFCSYKIIDYADLDKLDENIFSAIYTDLIMKFKNFQISYESSNISEKHIELLNGNVNIVKISDEILSYFKIYYNQLYNYYSLKKNEDKEDFITDMLQWLLTGVNNNLEKNFQHFLDFATNFYGDNDWFLCRWKSFFSYLKGDIQKAIEFAEKAYNIAIENDLPEWLINNIIIDIRNLAMQSNNWDCFKKYQELLNNNKNILFLPVIDRFSTQIYDRIFKDKLKFSTMSEYSISLGNDFKDVLKDVENYFFVSMMYGSYTHLYSTRKILFDVLFLYGDLFSNSQFLFESAKLLLLDSKTDEFNNFIKKYWELLYPIITTHADELWLLTNELNSVVKQSVKIILVKQFSLYFSDNIYNEEIKRFIITFYNENNELLLSEYLDMIACNCFRLDNNIIIELLLSLNISHPLFFSKFIYILFQLDLNSITTTNHKRLNDFLKKHNELLAKNNSYIHVIAYLINYNKKIYKELKYINGNGLIGVDKRIFNYEITNKQIEIAHALKDETISLNNKIDELINVKQYAVVDYFYKIKYLLEKLTNENTIDIINVLEIQLFDLIKKTINLPLPIEVKDSALSTLALLLCFSNKLLTMSNALIISLRDNVKDEFGGIKLINKKSYSLRKKTLELIIQKDDYLLYSIQSDYHNFSFIERRTIIETLFYFFYKFKDNNYDKSYLIILVLNALNDKHEDIRLLSTQTLAYYLKYFFNNNYLNLLKNKAFDSSYKVRRTLLSLCEDHFFNNDYLIQILEILKNDLNYEIKTIANSLLEGVVKKK